MKVVICLLAAASCLAAQPAQEAEVRGFIAEFLKAFNDLDWPAFQKC